MHGVPPDSVAFHEVGAVDSIADIVAAAAIMSAIGPTRWTIAALPLGGGTVRTAHGVMPVPAPATALLLEGFILHDDGTGGERVTADRCGDPALSPLPGARRDAGQALPFRVWVRHQAAAGYQQLPARASVRGRCRGGRG